MRVDPRALHHYIPLRPDYQRRSVSQEEKEYTW